MTKTPRFFAAAVLLAATLFAVDVIDEIYAVVNDEIITLRELRTFEQASLREIETRLSGDELIKARDELKKNVMNLMINQKLVRSKLKEKNYNVDRAVEQTIEMIKKQNNLESVDDLKRALQTQGLSFDEWKEQLRDFHKINQLKYDEIGSKIKIDNSQIMEYYRAHQAEFTEPEEVTVNAIYMKKEGSDSPQKELMERIGREATPERFAELAKAHSQLADAATSPELGKFKAGELAKELDEQVAKMKVGEISPWVEAATGWYLLHLAARQEAKLKEFREVRDSISDLIREQIENEKFAGYIEQLKKESYIKILKPYPAE